MSEVRSKKYEVRKICFFFTVLCSLILCTFSHGQDKFPRRIISLGPSITEQLYLLGEEDRLIGCTTYCNIPEEAQNIDKVGTVIDVNLEKIVSLKPDLVLATPLTDNKAIEKLKNLGIRVVIFPSPKSLSEICEQFLGLGKIVGKTDKAEAIIDKVKREVERIKKRTRHLPKPKVIVQIGVKPLWVATKDSFVNDLIEFAGGINAANKGKTGLYSREKVLESNPDIIIIVTMGIVGEEEKKIWGKYKILKASKNNQIFIIDSYKLCSPTPVSFLNTLKEIFTILHSK